MARRRRFFKATEFSPHQDDRQAFQELSELHCKFALTPRGRIYLVSGLLTDSHIKALFKLPQLIEVSTTAIGRRPSLTDCGFQELLSHPNLRVFSCTYNTALSDDGMAAVAKSPSLQWLGLLGSGISDMGVERISNRIPLLGLYLPQTNITEACVKHLCKLKNLRRLRLNDTCIVSSEARSQLMAALPKCHALQMGDEKSC